MTLIFFRHQKTPMARTVATMAAPTTARTAATVASVDSGGVVEEMSTLSFFVGLLGDVTEAMLFGLVTSSVPLVCGSDDASGEVITEEVGTTVDSSVCRLP